MEWLADVNNIFKLIGTLAAGGFFFIKVREWQRGIDVTLVEERLRREFTEVARKEKHDTVIECNALIGKLERRLEDANERTSKLSSFVQALPTNQDVSAVWKELTRVRESVENAQRMMGTLGERIARIEGARRGNQP